LGSHGPQEIPTLGNRAANAVEEKYSDGSHRVGATKVVARSRESKVVKLLWVPHYYRAPVTIFVIKQLLCLVYDGCLWLEESIGIPIMDNLIHRITRLPCKGADPADISKAKSNDLAIAEAMKKKFKLEKKKRGYAISNINNNAIRVATQILEGVLISSSIGCALSLKFCKA